MKLMLAGLRSRWTMPWLWAASRASATCRAMAMASSTGMRPRLIRSAERLALHQLHDQEVAVGIVLDLVDGGDVRVIETRPGPVPHGQKRAIRSRILGEELGQDLDRHIAAELGVLGPIDLAHTALAELVGDLEVRQCLANHRSTPSPCSTSALKRPVPVPAGRRAKSA